MEAKVENKHASNLVGSTFIITVNTIFWVVTKNLLYLISYTYTYFLYLTFWAQIWNDFDKCKANSKSSK